MTEPNIRYVAQDKNLNGRGLYSFDLPSDLLDTCDIYDINTNITYEDIEGGVTGKFSIHSPDLSAIIHCKCKTGTPTSCLTLRFLSNRQVEVSWSGVTRIFIRIRIIESTPTQTLINMLLDDLRSGYSLSDVEDPDIDQSFRPWSDDDDSENDTIHDHS
jgi:hypothetical protein